MITLSMSSVSFAKFQYLWKGGSGTWVSTEHGDSYWADTYYGEASIKGTDRGYSNRGELICYTWTKITYDVQGDLSYKIAYSPGQNSSRRVSKK